MKEVGGVHVLEALETLIDDILLVDVLQDVCPDDCVKIRVHKVKYQVDVTIVLCPDDVLKSDDVLVPVQLLQENNFSECSLGICRILEGVKVLLQSNNLLGSLIDGLPHDTVGSFSKLLENLVLFEDVRLDFFSHSCLLFKSI